MSKMQRLKQQWQKQACHLEQLIAGNVYCTSCECTGCESKCFAKQSVSSKQKSAKLYTFLLGSLWLRQWPSHYCSDYSETLQKGIVFYFPVHLISKKFLWTVSIPIYLSLSIYFVFFSSFIFKTIWQWSRP